jgi:hypothetical protein
MKLVDALSVGLIAAAGVAFLLGDGALAEAEDLRAFYWLAVGAFALRASVALVKPGARR